jgi:hypothetical protein
MSRSNHNGCGRSCGLCRPHKRFRHGKHWEHRSKSIERVVSSPAPSLAEARDQFMEVLVFERWDWAPEPWTTEQQALYWRELT